MNIGGLNGRKINSRIKEVNEPILMLNHYWDFSRKHRNKYKYCLSIWEGCK